MFSQRLLVIKRLTDSPRLLNENIGGIILSGGPLNVYENNKFKFDKKILKLGVTCS